MTEAYIRENATEELVRDLERFVASRSPSAAPPTRLRTAVASDTTAHRGPQVAARNRASIGMLQGTLQSMDKGSSGRSRRRG